MKYYREDSHQTTDLRAVAWHLLGLGFLLEFGNDDAVPSEDERIGIGKLVGQLGEELYSHILAEEERTFHRAKKKRRVSKQHSNNSSITDE